MRRSILLAAAGLALRCAPPAPGPFDAAPAAMLGGAPGRLIRSEKIEGAPPGALAWRVLYVSTGIDGKPIEVSGVVIASELPAPAAGRGVVAWAHPTTGVAENCAPSLREELFESIPHLTALVALDYVVVATDYPGLGTAGPHPYLVGLSEGRAILDSVRAAREIPAAGAGRRFVAWGHSQGGQAALFAGELAREYAPELELSGVAAIAPATDLAQLLKDDVGERSGRIIASYAFWSWSRVYGAPLDAVVPASELPAIDRVARDCVETTGEAFRAALDSLPLPAGFLKDGAYEASPWKSLLEQNRPGRSPTRAPIYVAQGREDEIVRPSVTADFVAELCRRGEIVRFESLPGVDHLRAARASATSAIQWMRDRLDGKPARNGCLAPVL